MTASRPLEGLRVLVTRPQDQAGGLCQLIEQAGGIAVALPLLDIAPIPDIQQAAQQLSCLAHYHYLIFISPNAVKYGLSLIQQFAPEQNLPTVLAVGSGSARCLQQAGITQVLAPNTNFDSEGLLALTALQQIEGKKVLICRGETGRELLGDTLKARGASVDYLACYQRSKANISTVQLQQTHTDVISVSSSEAVSHLSELADTTLKQQPLFAPHPRIATLAQQQGWQQVIETPSGDEALLQTLINWRQKQK